MKTVRACALMHACLRMCSDWTLHDPQAEVSSHMEHVSGLHAELATALGELTNKDIRVNELSMKLQQSSTDSAAQLAAFRRDADLIIGE